MCISEIWTYRECGCSYDHIIPCHIKEKQQDHVPSLFQTILAGSPPQNPAPVSNPSDIVVLTAGDGFLSNANNSDSSQPVCSVRNTVHKHFLEPICDDCVIEEGRLPTLSNPGLTSGSDSAHASQSRLILDSEVIIEIENNLYHEQQVDSQHSAMTKRNLEAIDHQSREFIELNHTSFLTPTRDSSPSICDPQEVYCRPSRLRTDNSSTNSDADDEGSLYLRPSLDSTIASPRKSPPRGRQRSRTGRRRKGIDINHQDLQISSRCNSGEQEDMENLRAALKDMIMDNKKGGIIKRMITKQDTSPWMKVKSMKSIVKGFSASLSRSRSRRKIVAGHHGLKEANSDGLLRLTSCQQALHDEYYNSRGMVPPSTLRMVEDHDQSISSEGECHDSPPSMSHETAESFVSDHDGDSIEEMLSDDKPQLSWEEHLEHDLAQRRQRKRQQEIRLNGPNNSDTQECEFRSGLDPSPLPNLPKSDIHFTTKYSSPSRTPTNAGFPPSNTATDIEDTPQRPMNDISPSPAIYTRMSSSFSSPSATMERTSSAWPLLFEAGERLGEVLASGEFERIDDDGSYWQLQGSGQTTLADSSNSIFEPDPTPRLANTHFIITSSNRSMTSVCSFANSSHRSQLRYSSSSSTTDAVPEDEDRQSPGRMTSNGMSKRNSDLIDCFPEPPKNNRVSPGRRVSSMSWPGSRANGRRGFSSTSLERCGNMRDSGLSIHPLTTSMVHALSLGGKGHSAREGG